jgi:hypothetical protein
MLGFMFCTTMRRAFMAVAGLGFAISDSAYARQGPLPAAPNNDEPGVAVPSTAAVDIAKGPKCAKALRHCFGIQVWIRAENRHRQETVEWFKSQVEGANRIFSAVSIGFSVEKISLSNSDLADVRDASVRDELGRQHRGEAGLISVFVVDRLADIDVANAEIRGVHWRHRSGNQMHYVILSEIAGALVLAHELGHFFGLPHSRYPASIMNKRPREQPPYDQRGFVKQEQAIVRSFAQGYSERAELKNVQRKKEDGINP